MATPVRWSVQLTRPLTPAGPGRLQGRRKGPFGRSFSPLTPEQLSNDLLTKVGSHIDAVHEPDTSRTTRSPETRSRSTPRPGTARPSRPVCAFPATLTGSQVIGNQDPKDRIDGELEIKQSQPKYGSTTTATWYTNNLVKAQLELDGQLAKGAPGQPRSR